MGLAEAAERAMGMSEAVWARHASPWSVWTRIATFPFLMLALWSHVWIGWWAAVPVALVAAWSWVNPRLFPPPRRTDTWPSKGTFGERVWLNRQAVPIPLHHRRAAQVTLAISGLGTVSMLAGAVLAEPISFLAGGVGAFLGKLWFVDRMVWLYEDMKDADPAYRSWLR